MVRPLHRPAARGADDVLRLGRRSARPSEERCSHRRPGRRRPQPRRGRDRCGSVSDAIATFLACSVDKTAEYGCTIVPWYAKEDRPKGLFARQAIPMVWDYAEDNPLGAIGGAFEPSVKIVAGALSGCPLGTVRAEVTQFDAVTAQSYRKSIVSTDPPYYDNIGYADLSD